MTLGGLIERLKSCPLKDKVVELGFDHAHSYRGYYDQLAFEPKKNMKIQKMLDLAETCVGHTFVGWKGGEYVMDKHVDVWIAFEGESGDSLNDAVLDIMLGQNHFKERWYKND